MRVTVTAFAFAALAVARRWKDDAGGRFMFGALFAAAALYLAWWVLLTPTQEAWLRRIMNGLIVGEILAIVVLYRLAVPRNPVTAVAWIVLGVGVGLSVAHNQLLWDRPDDRVDSAANRAFYEEVAALPPDAELYAAAWYQSPVTALMTGRRFYDFTRHRAAEINGNPRERFLVIEQVALYQHGWLAEVLGRCECEPVFANAGGRIYRIAGIDDNGSRAALRSTFITATSDGFGRGFLEGNADVRWASERAELRLPAADFDTLVLWLHAPPSIWRGDRPERVPLEIRRGECVLVRKALSPGENHLIARNDCREAKETTLEFRTSDEGTTSDTAAEMRKPSWLFRSMELMSRTPQLARENSSQDGKKL